jgi:hypothetical protein
MTRGRPPLRRSLVEAGTESDIAADGVVEQHDILADQAHLRTQVAERVLAHVMAIDHDAAVGRVIKTRQQADEGGFAAAGTPTMAIVCPRA